MRQEGSGVWLKLNFLILKKNFSQDVFTAKENNIQQPNIKNTIKDDKKDVTYHIMAYRILSKDEMVEAVKMVLSQKAAKTVKKGQVVTIITIIGAND